jgi:hypothetical protein
MVRNFYLTMAIPAFPKMIFRSRLMATQDDINRDFEPGVTENILSIRSDERDKNSLRAAAYRSLTAP